MSFRTDLAALKSIRVPADRGREFEAFVARLFADAGFETHRNPRTATPRQSDILATSRGLDLLIEAKWESTRIGVPDVADLRDRLSRSANTVVGCIISMSDYPKSAVDEVLRLRERDILLFNGYEIEQLARGSIDLAELIGEKRTHLRRDARVHMRTRTQRVRTTERPNELIALPGRDTVKSFVSPARWDVTFAAGLLARDDATHEVEYDLTQSPKFETLDGLAHLLAWLRSKFALTRNGAFNLQQEDVAWHGVGESALFAEARRWKARYRRAGLSRHHRSESIQYVSAGPWCTVHLSAQVRVSGNRDARYVQNSVLCLRVTGIPVDVEPFLKLAAYTNTRWATCRSTPLGVIERARFAPVALDVIGLIRANIDRESVVVGVVAKNPFERRALPSVLRQDKSRQLSLLARSKILMCSLRDWHGAKDIKPRYVLVGARAIEGPDGPILEPVATWAGA